MDAGGAEARRAHAGVPALWAPVRDEREDGVKPAENNAVAARVRYAAAAMLNDAERLAVMLADKPRLARRIAAAMSQIEHVRIAIDQRPNR